MCNTDPEQWDQNLGFRSQIFWVLSVEQLASQVFLQAPSSLSLYKSSDDSHVVICDEHRLGQCVYKAY